MSYRTAMGAFRTVAAIYRLRLRAHALRGTTIQQLAASSAIIDRRYSQNITESVLKTRDALESAQIQIRLENWEDGL